MTGAESSLFNMLNAEKFTSLIAQYNWQNNELQLTLKKEWSDKVDWSKKRRKGTTKKIQQLETSETKNLALKYDLDHYLDEVLYLIREGRHEQVAWYYDPIHQAKCILVIHSKRMQTIGNIRRVPVQKPEYEVLADTLNLARNTSFRCAVARLPWAGASLSFQAPPVTPSNMESLMGFLVHLVERENIRWGVEFGFSEEEMEKLEHGTAKAIADQDKEGTMSSLCAAEGIYLVILEAMALRYKSSQLGGKLIGIQGLGKIGSVLAERLYSDGADLIVCDVNPSKVDTFCKKKNDPARITVASPNEIKMQMGHVFSPCGEGHVGILTRDSIRGLGYHIVAGGAAHLLQANTQQEEVTLANRLLSKAVLYIPDWISNLGSLMYAVHLIEGKGVPEFPKIKEILEQTGIPALREILQNSQRKGISPLEEAYEKFTPVVYGTKAP